MSQDERKQNARGDREPGEDSLEERDFSSEEPIESGREDSPGEEADAEYEGRVPDSEPIRPDAVQKSDSETSSDDDARKSESTTDDAGSGEDTGDGEGKANRPGTDEQPGYSYDEDGNPDYYTMVEPGDNPPTDSNVRAEDPYRVEPYTDEDPYRYDYYEDNYADTSKELTTTDKTETKVATSGGGGPTPPDDDTEVEEDDEEDGMLRMSFMDHLEELRSRLLKIVGGLGLAFAGSIVFSPNLWQIVSQPATKALTELGIDPPNLTQITPMEAFNVVYIKLPLISALFLASPWILYQVWGFIAPGLYKRERKWAAPFIIGSAGLFILGGLFAYFVAFRFGLTFLLGIGRDINITPMVSITEYFDLFVNVVLAISLVFELPVLIFFLTLLRIVNPGFLIRNSRYAILGIVVLAAIITPTPDVFNLMIFSVPMIVLFFVGVLLSYVLVIHQEGRRFPWHVLWWTMGGLALIAGSILAVAILYYGYQWQWVWPFLTK